MDLFRKRLRSQKYWLTYVEPQGARLEFVYFILFIDFPDMGLNSIYLLNQN